MVRLIRKPGRKVDIKTGHASFPLVNKKEQEIKKMFSEIKKAEQIISEIGQGKSEKKASELQKISNIWKEFEKINLYELTEDELVKIINSQKRFISDLIKNYSKSLKG